MHEEKIVGSPIVGVVGGSTSDFPLLEKGTAILEQLGIPHELRVVSAHRTPDWLFEYAESASDVRFIPKKYF